LKGKGRKGKRVSQSMSNTRHNYEMIVMKNSEKFEGKFKEIRKKNLVRKSFIKAQK
jgi:hypothetical protein